MVVKLQGMETQDGRKLLAGYLRKAKLSQNAFARKMGVASAMVSRWITGQRRPFQYLFDIERASGGEVPANSWTKVHPSSSPRSPKSLKAPHLHSKSQ